VSRVNQPPDQSASGRSPAGGVPLKGQALTRPAQTCLPAPRTPALRSRIARDPNGQWEGGGLRCFVNRHRAEEPRLHLNPRRSRHTAAARPDLAHMLPHSQLQRAWGDILSYLGLQSCLSVLDPRVSGSPAVPAVPAVPGLTRID
jgi:hypothetical protein